MAERHGAAYCLDQDRNLNLPAYWLGLCLDNLLRNARQHGRPPIRILASWKKGRLRLAVSDGGALPRYRLSLLRRELGAGAGMGLGLAIVRRVMKRLGGRLTLEGPPTTFALELPCDDIAD
ncbi:ATP-binding protein [Chromobacterium phragmitis]|uniref:ATP-binding protein n=1 Tax=Chromobacterium phragmitis TaxID=2202141 RepID=UPI00143DFA46|nr:ATP-binding protein [Chromobacterium phragmitis]